MITHICSQLLNENLIRNTATGKSPYKNFNNVSLRLLFYKMQKKVSNLKTKDSFFCQGM